MKVIQIPFDGFYESITDLYLDDIIESEKEHRKNEGLPMFTDYNVKSFGEIAIEWSKNYKNWLEKEHNLKLESLTFESLSMPREYNFTTDRIFCNISDEDILKLNNFAINNHLDHATVQARFASRDGFHSFYDNFVNEWRTKPVLEWDYNELSILFPPFEDNQTIYDIWEDSHINGFFYNCIEFKEVEQE